MGSSRKLNLCKGRKDGHRKNIPSAYPKVLIIEYLQSSNILSHDPVTGMGIKPGSWKRTALKSPVMSLLWDENFGG